MEINNKLDKVIKVKIIKILTRLESTVNELSGNFDKEIK